MGNLSANAVTPYKFKKTMSLAKIEVSNNFTLTYFITEPNKVLGEPQFLNF